MISLDSLNRCPLSFHLPFVVFEGTLIKSYKSIMIWIWNVIICFPILYWAFPLLRPLRVESEVRCRGMDFFLRPQRGQPRGICVTSKWSCFFPLPTRINHFRRSFLIEGPLVNWEIHHNSIRHGRLWEFFEMVKIENPWNRTYDEIWCSSFSGRRLGRRKLPTSFASLPSQDEQQTTHLLQMMAVF